jgi:hypothetical protein
MAAGSSDKGHTAVHNPQRLHSNAAANSFSGSVTAAFASDPGLPWAVRKAHSFTQIVQLLQLSCMASVMEAEIEKLSWILNFSGMFSFKPPSCPEFKGKHRHSQRNSRNEKYHPYRKIQYALTLPPK